MRHDRNDSNLRDDVFLNDGTCIAESATPVPAAILLGEALPMAVAYVGSALQATDSDIAVVAVHWRQRIIKGIIVALEAHEGPMPISVGRHQCAELSLPEDKLLSLRHALVILTRDSGGHDVTRILDLRSGMGLQDAQGSEVASLIADGPVALRLGDTALFVARVATLRAAKRLEELSLAEPKRWIPEVSPEKLMRERRMDHCDDETAVEALDTSSSLLLEPSPGHKTSRPAVPEMGRLVLENANGRSTLRVDDILSRVGVLIGRYERCDLRPVWVNEPVSQLSRVHALAIAIEDELWLFDVGSTNGLKTRTGLRRSVPFKKDKTVSVIVGRSLLSWLPARI